MSMTVKESIPDAAALRARLDTALDRGISDFIARTDQRRIEVIRNQRYAIVSVVVFVIALLLLFLSDLLFDGWTLRLLTMSLLGLVLAAVILATRWHHTTKILAQEINLALVPTLTSCLNRLVMYTHDTVHRGETKVHLERSQLLPNVVDELIADDIFTIDDPYPLTIREINVSRYVRHGDRVDTERVFEGTLAAVQLPRDLAGHTFISTSGDVYGFGHRTFWDSLLGHSQYTAVELEWNEHPEVVHVASSDPAEARSVLTPEFIDGLHEWWRDHGRNVRIALVGHWLYILLPDANVRIGTSTTSVDKRHLKQYTMTVLMPIWRTLTLAEEVRLS